MTRNAHNKRKKYTISLSEREGRLLQLYAVNHDITKPQALRRIVKGELRNYHANPSQEIAKNQLGLFDSVQIDIFNNNSKTNNSN